jgi:hypothetical protein
MSAKLHPDRFELIPRREILREPATSTDAEVRAMEMERSEKAR